LVVAARAVSPHIQALAASGEIEGDGMGPLRGPGAWHPQHAVFSGVDQTRASHERALRSADVRIHVAIRVSSRHDRVSFGRRLARSAQAEPSGSRLRNVRTKL